MAKEGVLRFLKYGLNFFFLLVQLFGRVIKASIAIDNGRAAEFIRRRNYFDKSKCYECGVSKLHHGSKTNVSIFVLGLCFLQFCCHQSCPTFVTYSLGQHPEAHINIFSHFGNDSSLAFPRVFRVFQKYEYLVAINICVGVQSAM